MYPGFQNRVGLTPWHVPWAFPVLIWIEHPSADYYVCEQDSCGGESGYAHLMSPVPNPMYPLPISSTFRHATSEWNQDKDRCHRNKNPDRIRCKQDCAPRRVPTEPGLRKTGDGQDDTYIFMVRR